MSNLIAPTKKELEDFLISFDIPTPELQQQGASSIYRWVNVGNITIPAITPNNGGGFKCTKPANLNSISGNTNITIV